ncbi:GNAT family N-acetyltransferase [Rhizobium sp. YIM 134829]|uniref:GNAT family N-acetyltransferase n=1 Tax=Rhizobium sp. YIM 134829 TaxID=3390453 RepID=UPI003979F858
MIETERLRLRAWLDGDRALFHDINSDPEVMAFFAVRRSREEADAMMDRLNETIARTGRGWFAVAEKESDVALGMCGLADANLTPLFPADMVEIGWRLARPFWGKGYVTETALALLRLGFEDFGLPEIVSFAVPENDRSLAVMQRLGFRPDPTRDFDHPRVPDTHPALKRHVFHAMTARHWAERQSG